jgi:beta-galactosidase
MPLSSPVEISRSDVGEVVLATSTVGASIYYSLNDGEYQLYEVPFSLVEGGNIQAYSIVDGGAASIITSATFYLFINKTDWKVISYSSQQAGNEASKAIDNDASTIWHTAWGTNEPTYPHEIVIDMQNTYQVKTFQYRGRSDVSNGRVKGFEVYVSNHTNIWGSAVASGEFTNTNAMQLVVIEGNPVGRYLKLIAKSEVNAKAWASAAEIGIEASAIVDPVTENCIKIDTSKKYYIKHIDSGLYLQYIPGTIGEFKLQTLLKTNPNFTYVFVPVNGFTSSFNLKLDDNSFMNQQNGWRVISGIKTDNEGRIQIEFMNDCKFKMRGLWQLWKYINLDTTTPWSLIYGDKTEGAVWQLEEVEPTSVKKLETNTHSSVYPTFSKGEVNIVTATEATTSIINFSGHIIDSFSSMGTKTVAMNYPNGIYLFCIEMQDEFETHKVILNK